MGLLGTLKDKITHKDDMPLDDIETTRSHVLGEPTEDVGNDYVDNSRYAPPSLARQNTQRTHNIGPTPNSTVDNKQNQGPGVVGRTANDLMPADRVKQENPMYAPAPQGPVSSGPSQQSQGPPSLQGSSGPDANNEKIIEKIEYLRQDIRSLKNDIELLSERIKNIQQRVERRNY